MFKALVVSIIVQSTGSDVQQVWTNCEYSPSPFVAVCDGYEEEPINGTPNVGVMQTVIVEGREGSGYYSSCNVAEQGTVVLLQCEGWVSSGFE